MRATHIFLPPSPAAERQNRTDSIPHHTSVGGNQYQNLPLIKAAPLSQRLLEWCESGRKSTYLEEGRDSGFQVLHDAPIIRPCQVQVSVREAYPLQQDGQEFRDIISPDIQENPG